MPKTALNQARRSEKMPKPRLFDMMLQLFAEGEGTPPEPEVQTEKDNEVILDLDNIDKPYNPWEVEVDPPKDDTADKDTEVTEPDDPAQGDEFSFDITYNGETITITDPDELRTYAQKGRNYDKVQQRLQEYERQITERDEWVKSTYGDRGIDTWADFQKALAEEQQQKRTQELEQSGVDKDQLREIINSDPEIRAIKAKAEQYEQMAQQQAFETRITSEIKALNDTHGLDVKTLEDIPKLDNAQQVIDYADKGLSLADAYWMANREAIIEKRTLAAKQAALTNDKSKGHVRKNGSNADGADVITVPDKVFRDYKLINPDMTNAQIKAHYAKSLKGR